MDRSMKGIERAGGQRTAEGIWRWSSSSHAEAGEQRDDEEARRDAEEAPAAELGEAAATGLAGGALETGTRPKTRGRVGSVGDDHEQSRAAAGAARPWRGRNSDKRLRD